MRADLTVSSRLPPIIWVDELSTSFTISPWLYPNQVLLLNVRVLLDLFLTIISPLCNLVVAGSKAVNGYPPFLIAWAYPVWAADRGKLIPLLVTQYTINAADQGVLLTKSSKEGLSFIASLIASDCTLSNVSSPDTGAPAALVVYIWDFIDVFHPF